VHVEVIDGWPLSSRDVIHKTIPLEVKFGNHCSSIIFNIIKTLSAVVILKLSRLERYNLQIDWKLQNMEFLEIPSLTECTNNPLSTKKPPFIQPLFIGARTFIRAIKIGTSFAICATPTSRKTITSTSIPIQKRNSKMSLKRKYGHLVQALTVQLCH
jgi:hypothetical protein